MSFLTNIIIIKTSTLAVNAHEPCSAEVHAKLQYTTVLKLVVIITSICYDYFYFANDYFGKW